MSEWKEIKLADLLDIKHGFAFPGSGITEEKTNHILVTPGNFNIGGGFKSMKLKYFKGNYPEEYVLKADDLVVTMTDLSQETDTLGYSAKIPHNNYVNYLHNQRIGLIKLISNEVNKDFIYWLMRTKEYQSFIVSSASGTAIMHTSPSRIKEYSCLIPPLSEQENIAEILSSLEEKINLLGRNNKTLEEFAETIFRQWFVEEAEESWERGKMNEFVNIVYGKNLPTKNLIQDGYPVFGANGKIGCYDKYIYELPQVLVSCRGEASGTVNFSEEKSFVTNNSLILERTKNNKISFSYLKYFSLQTDYRMFVTGSAQPQITIESLNKAEFFLPPQKLIENFNKLVDDLENKRTNNTTQIQQLELLRDTLLPKLMSGVVRVVN
jgi:type I restriction enzyme S subunit